MHCQIKSPIGTLMDATCGERYPLYDAAGIFCCYVCSHCEAAKRRGFNPAIFDRASRYAMTGEESDILPDLLGVSDPILPD